MPDERSARNEFQETFKLILMGQDMRAVARALEALDMTESIVESTL